MMLVTFCKKSFRVCFQPCLLFISVEKDCLCYRKQEIALYSSKIGRSCVYPFSRFLKPHNFQTVSLVWFRSVAVYLMLIYAFSQFASGRTQTVILLTSLVFQAICCQLPAFSYRHNEVCRTYQNLKQNRCVQYFTWYSWPP